MTRKHVIETMPIATAAELVAWLTNDPIDLNTVFVTDADGGRVLPTMVRETLTDGSLVYNLEIRSASS